MTPRFGDWRFSLRTVTAIACVLVQARQNPGIAWAVQMPLTWGVIHGWLKELDRRLAREDSKR